MSEFLVEVYVSRAAAPTARQALEQVRGAADELRREGQHIRFLHSIFVPADETCFYLFEAQSDDAVREAANRSGLLIDRVVAAVCESGSRS
jgi:hypothetical protein